MEEDLDEGGMRRPALVILREGPTAQLGGGGRNAWHVAKCLWHTVGTQSTPGPLLAPEGPGDCEGLGLAGEKEGARPGLELDSGYP